MTAAGNEWIEWNGGECPVGRFDSGWARLRCDHPDFQGGVGPYNIGGLRWEHNGGNGDIIAYRLAAQPSELPESSRDAGSALTRQPGGTHYRDATIQPVQFIEANKLGFLEGCIVKRAARHDKPTGKGREDIEKIIHEAQLLLELRYGADLAKEMGR